MNGSLATCGFKKPRDIASFEDAIEKSRTETGLINIGVLRSKICMVDGGIRIRDDDPVDLTVLLIAIGALCAQCAIERRNATARLEQLESCPELYDRMLWLRDEAALLAHAASHPVDKDKLQAVSDWAGRYVVTAGRQQIARVA